MAEGWQEVSEKVIVKIKAWTSLSVRFRVTPLSMVIYKNLYKKYMFKYDIVGLHVALILHLWTVSFYLFMVRSYYLSSVLLFIYILEGY